jgi:hypothetical protein
MDERPGYHDVASLFTQTAERLAPTGRVYVLFSSDSYLELMGALYESAGFRAHAVRTRWILFESFIIFELRMN